MKNLHQEHASPRNVDFHAYASDLKCVLLASMGLTTKAISEATDLTPSQVEYRLRKAEQKERGAGLHTARYQYRNGTSPVVRIMIQQFAEPSRKLTITNNAVRDFVTKKLDKVGLYGPRSKGVMHDREL